jgi:predicted nicotinamide N-methyase
MRELRARFVRVADVDVVVYEAKDPGKAVDEAIARRTAAPYGAVLWDAAVDVAGALAARDLTGVRVLEIGCGCGLCGVVAALRGAEVLCTDVDDEVFAAVERAALDAGVGERVRTASFDMLGDAPLPPADVVVIADVLYEPVLAAGAARRTLEALARGSEVVVGDPERAGRTEFLRLLADAGRVVTFRGHVLALPPSAPQPFRGAR